MKTLRRRFDAPDEVQTLGPLRSEVVTIGGGSVARTVHPAGWRWSEQVRPHVGTERCLARHTGTVVSGVMEVAAEDGSRERFGPGDLFDIAPGHDGWVVGDEPCVTLEWSGTQEWLQARDAERMLATILFTDIVDSTLLAGRMGDRAWRALLSQHDELIRRIVTDARGRLVKHTGDGVLALFDGPARALGAASRIHEGVRTLGIHVRAGIHVGEIEARGEDVAGLAVHEAARVLSAAGAGETLVSEMARTLCTAAGFSFESRGPVALKGIEGLRALFALVRSA